jgi:hypothetical protein
MIFGSHIYCESVDNIKNYAKWIPIILLLVHCSMQLLEKENICHQHTFQHQVNKMGFKFNLELKSKLVTKQCGPYVMHHMMPRKCLVGVFNIFHVSFHFNKVVNFSLTKEPRFNHVIFMFSKFCHILAIHQN